MDRFEKHAEYIMKRGEKILAAKEKRNKYIRRISCSCSGVAAAAIISFLAWKSVPASTDLPSDITIQESTAAATTSYMQTSAERTEAVSATVSTISDNAIISTVTVTANVQTSVPAGSSSGVNNATETEPTKSVTTAVQTVITTAQNNDVKNTEPVSSAAEPPSEYVSEVFWGYNEDIDYGDPDRDPMPMQNLAMKCKSFCAAGEKLTVDVAMADNGVRSFGDDKKGDYKYEVAVCDPKDYKNIDDRNFIVNGERRRYKKEYSCGEAGSFEYNGKHDDYDSYHHETTVLDFTNYEVGSSGCIKFAFEIEFADNPNHTVNTTANQYMYFYVGENGTFISNKSIENKPDDVPPMAHDKTDDRNLHGHHNHHGFDS